jgi:hypothetical protein
MADTTITSITPISGGITIFGNKRIVIADILFDGGTWPTTTGVPLVGSQFGLQALDAVIVTGQKSLVYNWASDVLQAYLCTTAGAASVIANGVATSDTIRVIAIGYGLK